MISGVLFDMGGTLLDYGGLGAWDQALDRAYRGVYEVLGVAGYRSEWAEFRSLVWRIEDGLWNAARAGQAAPTLATEFDELLREVGLDGTGLPVDGEETRPSVPPLTGGLQGGRRPSTDPFLTLPVNGEGAGHEGLADRCAAVYGEGLRHYLAVFPESAGTLQALKARGLQVGLISNTLFPGEFHAADLARFDLLRHLDDLVFSSDAGLWKPQASVFRYALDRLGLRPEEAVFVGDRLIDDVGGAQGAGMKGVLVKPLPGDGPDHAAGRARGIVPDGELTSLADLLPLLDRWNGEAR